MKGLKKCFIVLLPLFITFLASCVISSDVSALRHEYLTIPAFSRQYVAFSDNSSDEFPGLEVSWSSDNIPSWLSNDSLNYQFIIGNSILNNNNSCIYRSTARQPFLSDNFSISSPVRVYGDLSGSLSSYYCRTIYSYGSSLPSSHFSISSVPSFDSSTFPSGLNWSAVSDTLRLQLPYSYAYSVLKLSDTAISSSGEEWSSSLAFSELFSGDELHVLSRFHSLTIPFDEINQSLTGAMIQNRPIEFKGQFYFPGVSNGSGFSFSPSFLSSGSFHLSLTALKPSYTPVLVDIPCDLRSISVPGSFNLLYSCKTTLSQDFSSYHLIPTLYISSSDYVFETSSDWRWAGAFLTTDNDDTPGQPISEDCQGNDCSSAPGSVDFPSESGDWFSQLTNLFNFNVINPFAPLFNLFTDNSSCGHIPTIAGMLGATDDTYCPWFSASTRNIVTPVFALASVMLLFGFFVRWLGASSGNLFEDSSSSGSSEVSRTSNVARPASSYHTRVRSSSRYSAPVSSASHSRSASSYHRRKK